MKVNKAKSTDIEKIVPTLLELRPHLNPDEVKTKLKEMQPEGYEMIFVGDQNTAFAVAGFRIMNTLFSGKTLYIDDLVTHSHYQKKGYANRLLNWIKQYAREINCDHISLDSGFTRKDAYRLYLNQGLEVESLHFGIKVSALQG